MLWRLPLVSLCLSRSLRSDARCCDAGSGASDCRDWETGRQAGDTAPHRRRSIWHLTAETQGDKRDASEHLASDRRDWETGGTTRPGDKRETRPRSQRHSIWPLNERLGDRRLGDTGREAGDTTPQPVSQHLASDRRDLARHRETSERHNPAASVTASGL